MEHVQTFHVLCVVNVSAEVYVKQEVCDGVLFLYKEVSREEGELSLET